MLWHYYDKVTGEYTQSRPQTTKSKWWSPANATLQAPDSSFDRPVINRMTGEWYDGDNPPDSQTVNDFYDTLYPDEAESMVDSNFKDIKVFLQRMSNTANERLYLKHPTFIRGVQRLEARNIITAARAIQVLRGEKVDQSLLSTGEAAI